MFSRTSSAGSLGKATHYKNSNDCVMNGKYLLDTNIEIKQQELLKEIFSIRKTKQLKLPDAIIAATAINSAATLISADQAFNKIAHLHFLRY